MKYNPIIRAEKCYLAPISTEDAPLYNVWFSNPRISINTRAFSNLFTVEFEKKRLENMASGSSHDSCMLAIVRSDDNSLIGSGGFFSIDKLNRIAELGIVIGDERLHGKGYGYQAMCLLLDYAFYVLNLNSVYLNVLSFNPNAIKLYEKCGFKHIGAMREARIIGDEKFDLVYMDILFSEYESVYYKKLLTEKKNT
jgi:RimJ/RimL family protein N-acetyltransferase